MSDLILDALSRATRRSNLHFNLRNSERSKTCTEAAGRPEIDRSCEQQRFVTLRIRRVVLQAVIKYRKSASALTIAQRVANSFGIALSLVRKKRNNL